MLSEADKRAIERYKKRYWKKITIELPIGEYEAMRAYIDEHGESMAGFIRRVINEKTEYKK